MNTVKDKKHIVINLLRTIEQLKTQIRVFEDLVRMLDDTGEVAEEEAASVSEYVSEALSQESNEDPTPEEMRAVLVHQLSVKPQAAVMNAVKRHTANGSCFLSDVPKEKYRQLKIELTR